MPGIRKDGESRMKRYSAAGIRSTLAKGRISRTSTGSTLKTSKYKNKITEVDGIKFHSKKEAKRYQELKLLEKARSKNVMQMHLELQPRFQLKVKDQLICTYVGDFMYWDDEKNKKIVEDVKGAKTGAAYDLFRIKKKLMKAIYGIDILET